MGCEEDGEGFIQSLCTLAISLPQSKKGQRTTSKPPSLSAERENPQVPAPAHTLPPPPTKPPWQAALTYRCTDSSGPESRLCFQLPEGLHKVLQGWTTQEGNLKRGASVCGQGEHSLTLPAEGASRFFQSLPPPPRAGCSGVERPHVREASTTASLRGWPRESSKQHLFFLQHPPPRLASSLPEATGFGKWNKRNSKASHSALISIIINRLLINCLPTERKS